MEAWDEINNYEGMGVMYKIGQKIVYPMLGAGTIQSIEKKEVLGKVNEYYTVKISFGEVVASVPVQSAEEVGLRDLMQPDEVDKVIAFIREYIPCDCLNWNKRYRENMNKLKSGNVYEIAEVAKALFIRDKEQGLSTGERKIFMNAKQIILSEIMLVKELSLKEAEEIVIYF